MLQTDQKATIPDKPGYHVKAKLTSFIRLHDLHHPVMITNTYLAVEKADKAVNGINTKDNLIMQDLFGALNY